MGFNKNKGISAVIALIVLVIFNLIAFLIPVSHSVTFWLGYSFATLSVVISLAGIILLFNKETANEQFKHFSIVSVSFIYLILQVILSIWQMIGIACPYILALILDVVLTGIALISILLIYAGIHSIGKNESKEALKSFYIRNLQSEIELIKTSDKMLNDRLMKIAETVRFSDIMSHSQLSGIEQEIESKVSALKREENGAVQYELCNEIEELLNERNKKCKLLKGVKDVEQSKDNSGIKFVAVAFGVLGFLATLALMIGFVFIPMNKYNNAERLYMEEEYEAASAIYEDLGTYRDSEFRKSLVEDKIQEQKYSLAEEKYRNNEYSDALSLYSDLGDYKDSKQRIEQIYNKMATEDEIYFGTFEDKPVAWTILKTEKSRMLLITKNPVAEMAFNNEVKNITWETSSIRQWLNNDFIKDFTTNEISDMQMNNNDDLNDKVFLLNEDEFNMYKGNVSFKTTSDWWLRTKTDAGMMYVNGTSEEINTYGDGVVRAKGIRPCIWINLR